jgi:hypothetical protein
MLLLNLGGKLLRLMVRRSEVYHSIAGLVLICRHGGERRQLVLWPKSYEVILRFLYVKVAFVP